MAMNNKESGLPSSVQKTTFTVLGICCGSEAALIYKILNPLQGIGDISVNVLAKTTTVIHDPTLVPASQIAEALNKAKLKAEIRVLGQVKTEIGSWPSANVVASGLFMVVAMFNFAYQPLIWIALASIVVGIPSMLRRSLAALLRCVLDINVLMVIAVIGAVGLGDYVEGASIVFLFTFAEWLEAKSSNKARASLEALMNLAPRTAVISETGERVPVRDVKLDAIVSVKAGECVPVDGIVLNGRSTVDESSLTGEFMPVDKEIDSKVWAGTLVVTGFMNVITKASDEETAVARMVKLVEDAQNKRSTMEEFIERFAKFYTPGVVLIAGGIAIVPLALGLQNFREWIYLSLVLLVVACPCALVISTPVAKVCGLSAAAKIGLIVKGGNHLESLAKLKAIAFDKTGTLTEGAFKVSSVCSIDPRVDIDRLLYWISSLENLSSHPMAKALVEYAKSYGIQPSKEVREFEAIPGKGISGFVQGSFVQIGNAQLALQNGWLIESQLHVKEAGITTGYVSVDDRFIGYFFVGDQIRGEAAEAVQELLMKGIQVTVLTGDSEAAAQLIRQQFGAKIKVEAGLSPEEKMNRIADIRARCGLTAMVGDGINDAPALAASDLGIAMGVAGSALAAETADVALMSDDLRKIPEAMELAKASMSKMYQNVALSLAVKLLFFGLAFAGLPSLWAAVVADMGTSLLVIFNSMLLLRKNGRSNASVGGGNKTINVDSGSISELEKPLLAEKREEAKVGGGSGGGCRCCSKGTQASEKRIDIADE